MRTTKNISGGILLLLIVGLVLVFAITPSRNISQSVPHNAAQEAQKAAQKQVQAVTHNAQTHNTLSAVKSQTATKPFALQPAGKLTAYLASRQQAIVGLYGGRETDNPADNILMVTIDRELQPTDRVWLNYRLAGVADHSGVACSVNDRLAFGGYLVKTDTTLRRQRVQLNAAWLRKGDNRIQFSLPTNATYGYKVSDLAIEVETNALGTEELVVNSSRKRYDGKVYVHGFVTGTKNAKLNIDGSAVTLRDGEFEYLAAADTTLVITAKLGKQELTRTLHLKQNLTPDHVFALQSEIKTEKTFRKNKSNTLETELALLKAPAKVTLNTVKLSSTTLRGIDLPAMDMGMTNVTSENRGVRFLPHGQHFGGDGATVALKYDRTKIPDGYTENDIRTYYFDTNTNHWVALERDTVNKELCMVVSKTTHFTDMINGVIKTPESPETQGFAPTMMNDIKAADPTAKIEMIAPPTANNQGSANLSYPIELPPARNGMNPNLAISYNSDGGSGWLGEGWDLNIPSITVDTRWGVPLYDNDRETETYLFNGVPLARTFIYDDGRDNKVFYPDRGVVYKRNKAVNEFRFYPRNQTDFPLIIRYGTAPNDYTWIVTDKKGTKYHYGIKQDPLASGISNIKGILSDGAYKIAEWKLQSIVDIHGDSVAFVYNTDANEDGYGDLKPKSIYLSQIRTYLFEKIEGNTKKYLNNTEINFLSSDYKKKTKKTNNARYGFLVSNQRLLDKIEIKSANANDDLQLLRSYEFLYKMNGTLLSDLLESIKVIDANNEISVHNFDYYDNTSNGINIFAQTPTPITNPNSNVVNNLITGNSIENANGILNNNNSVGVGGSLYAGVGLGLDFWSLKNSIGINTGYQTNTTNGSSQLIDINGDRLPDFVYLVGDKLYYKPFDLIQNKFLSPILIENAPSSFYSSRTNNFTLGLGANGSIFAFNIAGRVDWDLSNSTHTSDYFMDVNNDGLVDIVNNKKVHFNYLVNGRPTFSTNSNLTSMPMNKETVYEVSEGLPDIIRYDDTKDIEIEARANTLQDIVRVWRAPYSGVVNISGNVQLLAPTGDYDQNAYKEADGVRVAIQHMRQEIWSDKIGKTTFTPISVSTNTLVNQGDYIFFRVQSGDQLTSNGDFDNVSWAPKIKYLSTTGNIAEIRDICGYSNLEFISSEANFVSKTGYNMVRDDATINSLSIYLDKPNTNGNLTLDIYYSNSTQYYEDQYDSENNRIINPDFVIKKLAPRQFLSTSTSSSSSPLTISPSEINGKKYKYFWFKLSSTSNEKWNEIKCNVKINYQYINKNNQIRNDDLVAGVNYNTLYSSYDQIKNSNVIYNNKIINYIAPVVNQDYINNPLPTIPKTKDADFNIYDANSEYPGYAPVVMCKPIIAKFDAATNSLREHPISFLSGKIRFETVEGVFIKEVSFADLNQKIEINEFGDTPHDVENMKMSLYIDDLIYDNLIYAIGIYKSITTSINSGENLAYVLMPDKVYQKQEFKSDYGPMYRGWGHFQYNASYDRYKNPINLDSLYIPKDTSNFLFEDMHLVSLVPHIETKSTWQGLSDNIKLDGDVLTPGRLLSNSIGLKTFLLKDGPLRAPANTENSNYQIEAPILLTKQKNFSYQLSLSLERLNDVLKKLPKKVRDKISLSLSAGASSGSSTKVVDFIDMNGDGFPDYFNEGKILYSNSRGTQTNIYCEQPHAKENVKTINGSVGVSYPFYKSATTNLITQSSQEAAQIGGSVSVNKTEAEAIYDFIDINGDGLPDKIDKSDINNITVSINLGYSFSPAFSPTFELDFTKKTSFSHNAGLGIGYDIGAFSVGTGVASAGSNTYSKLIDMNGDGLPDLVYSNKSEGSFWDYVFKPNIVSVRLNNGNGFDSTPIILGESSIEKSISTTNSINTGGGWGFPLWGFKVVFSGNLQLSTTNSKAIDDIRDMNGDGIPDLVSTISTGLSVKTSTIGCTNKLKSVTNPLDGKFTIEYDQTIPTTDNPGSKWIMKKIILDDGVSDDEVSNCTALEYQDGKYNRREREFDGFGIVRTLNLNTDNSIYRKTIQTYDVSNNYVKGNLLSTAIYDGSDNLYSETNNKYYLYAVTTHRSQNCNDCDDAEKAEFGTGPNQGKVYNNFKYTEITDNKIPDDIIAFTPLKYSETKLVQPGSQNSTKTNSHYTYWVDYNETYNQFGALKSFCYSNNGALDENGGNDYDYKTEIDYYSKMTSRYFVADLPTTYTVKDKNGAIYRQTKAYYTHKGYPTHLTRVCQSLNEQGDSAVTHLQYDKYGNITHKLLPSKMAYSYIYDDKYKMYVTQVKDTFGYTYQMPVYDYRFGIPLKTIDINGNVMTQTVDNRGRIETITGPNEYVAGAATQQYTIKFEYVPQKIVKDASGTYTQMPYAITKHWDATQSSDKNLETVTFVDGFGRPIQVKKESMVNGEPKMIVSGRAKYDAFGRVKEAYYPVVGEMTNKAVFDTAYYRLVPPTRTTYDVLDRVLTTKLPDNSETKMDYSIAEGKLMTRVTDANGKYQDTYTTGDGKTVKTVQYKTYNGPTGSDPLTTLFEYDAINQLVKVTDAATKTTESIYDLAGRRTQVKHPASGITTFVYDAAGNLTEKLTANLRNAGAQAIKYQYDYNRLKEINYPLHPENDVKYVYGTKDETGAANGYRAGRLKSLEDGSGMQEYKYGKQGEVTELKRTLVIPNQAVATYVTQTAYDSWNRLLSMTYPDGEVVSYGYNTGGLLTNVKSSVNNYDYVENVLYDKFEQRTYLKYGNGKETNYTYKPTNRQLDHLTVGVGTNYIMNNAYTYDAVGNVSSITNTGIKQVAANTVSGHIGGTITHNYKYDNLYRLDSAYGDFDLSNTDRKAKYNLKMQYDNMHNIIRKKQFIEQTGIQFAGTLKAGYDLNYTINANNSQQISNIAENSYRTEGSGANTPEVKESQFSYDANGNLLGIYTGTKQGDKLKVTNTRKLLWDEENHLLASCDNGYLTSYYYDAAGERTVKMSGDAEGVFVNGVLSGGRTSTANFTAYINPYLNVRNGGEYTKHIYMGNQRITSKVSDSGIFGTSPVNTTDLKPKYANQTAALKLRYDSLGVQYKGVERSGSIVSSSPTGVSASYFYHPDHLGSSSLITDVSGDIVQHVEYVPFGGTFIDERRSLSSWHTPFLFSGKERDEETGLLYVSQRYQDEKYGIWYSVDQLAEEFPNVSSYVYCFNNPMNFIDPDGRKGRIVRQSVPTNQQVRYALFPNGQMPLSYNRTTTYRSSRNGNGSREIIPQPSPGKQYPSYVKTMTTSGGNEIQVTPNNHSNQGPFVTAVIEYMKDRVDNLSLFSISQDVVYNERGINKSSRIIINDPYLAKLQQDYDNLATKLNEQLGPIDYSKAKSCVEFIQLGANRQTQIENAIGKSPMSIIQNEIFKNPDGYKSSEPIITIKSEIRQGQ